jgi:hypothetical protein
MSDGNELSGGCAKHAAQSASSVRPEIDRVRRETFTVRRTQREDANEDWQSTMLRPGKLGAETLIDFRGVVVVGSAETRNELRMCGGGLPRQEGIRGISTRSKTGQEQLQRV